MATYDANKLTKLKALKDLAERVRDNYATKKELSTLSTKVEGLVTAGGEPNKIEKIKVNGAEQSITNKEVDIKVPTKVGDLNNDQKFQTESQVEATVKAEIAATGHASFEKAESIPSASTAKDNVLYLVMNAKTKHYDIYAKVGTEVVLLDDTTVDLTAYSTTEQITALLEGYVQKSGSKQLSDENYTSTEKNKLSGISTGANKVEKSNTNGNIKIDGAETQVYVHPTVTAKESGFYKVTVDGTGHVTGAATVEKEDITKLGIPAQDTTYNPAVANGANGLMTGADKAKLDGFTVAEDTEVAAMLTEVFGA